MSASGGTGGAQGRFAETARRRDADAARLLARGAAYALGSLADVGPETFGCPTPCAGWDLRALLGHLDASVTGLAEATTGGIVGPVEGWEACRAGAADLVDVVRDGITRLVGLRGDVALVAVGDCVLGRADLAVVGAMELTVHGWDVGRATGARRPVPPGLALGLLRHAPRLVTADMRGALFARPVPVPDATDPGDLLVAYLGRDPSGRGPYASA